MSEDQTQSNPNKFPHLRDATLAAIGHPKDIAALRKSLAPKKVNLNSDSVVGNFGVYEINVNEAIFKVGKADLGRVTKSSGLPTRLHQQVRKLEKVFGKGNVVGKVVDDLGKTTTAAAKQAEHASILDSFKKTGFVPLGT